MNFLKKLTILFVFQLNSSIGSSQGLNKDLNSKLHTPIYVLTTFSILEDFVKNIGGSDVVVQSLIQPGKILIILNPNHSLKKFFVNLI